MMIPYFRIFSYFRNFQTQSSVQFENYKYEIFKCLNIRLTVAMVVDMRSMYTAKMLKQMFYGYLNNRLLELKQ